MNTEVKQFVGYDRNKVSGLGLTLTAKCLYGLIDTLTTVGDLHVCKMTNNALAEYMEVSERTVKNAKAELRNAGLICTKGIRSWSLTVGEVGKNCPLDTTSKEAKIAHQVGKNCPHRDTLEKLKESTINRSTVIESDCHWGTEVTDVEVPEWLDEMPWSEPEEIVSWSDYEVNELLPTSESLTSKVDAGEDVMEDKNNSLSSAEPEKEVTVTGETVEDSTSKLGSLSDVREACGTIVHEQGESVPERLKSASTDVIGSGVEPDNEENNLPSAGEEKVTVTGETGMDMYKSQLYQRVIAFDSDFQLASLEKGSKDWMDTLLVYFLQGEKSQPDKEYFKYEVQQSQLEPWRKKQYHALAGLMDIA